MLRTLAIAVVVVLAFVLLLQLVGAVIKLAGVLLLIALVAAGAWLVLRRA